MGSGASTEHKSLIEGKTPEARGMQAQVSKFGGKQTFYEQKRVFRGPKQTFGPPRNRFVRASKQTFFAGRWQSSGFSRVSLFLRWGGEAEAAMPLVSVCLFSMFFLFLKQTFKTLVSKLLLTSETSQRKLRQL